MEIFLATQSRDPTIPGRLFRFRVSFTPLPPVLSGSRLFRIPVTRAGLLVESLRINGITYSLYVLLSTGLSLILPF